MIHNLAMHALFSSLSRNEVGHVQVHISAKLPNDKIKNYQDIGSAEYQKTQKAVESCGKLWKRQKIIQHHPALSLSLVITARFADGLHLDVDGRSPAFRGHQLGEHFVVALLLRLGRDGTGHCHDTGLTKKPGQYNRTNRTPLAAW